MSSNGDRRLAERTDIDFRNFLTFIPDKYSIPFTRKIRGGRGPRVKIAKKKKDELVEEFTTTLSGIDHKEIKDDDSAYFVLEFHASPLSSKYERLLNRMRVNLLAFLDREQKTALVESSYNFDLESVSSETRDILKAIRLMKPSEKIEESLRGSKSNELVIINTVPNVPLDKILNHMEKVQQFIRQNDGEVVTNLIDKENLRGSVIVQTTGELLERLADNSTVVLSAYKVPKMIMSSIKRRRKKQRVRSDEEYSIVASSLNENVPQNDTSYEIVEIDSGARDLQEFQGKVVSYPALSYFQDGHDTSNHGTPIASLLLFGEREKADQSSPFKVVSYKAIDEKIRTPLQDLYAAINFAFDNYKGQSRVYACSLNYPVFEDWLEQETRKIELLIHSKNVCFVNSVGNISDAEPRMNRGEKRRTIWKSSPVLHPADARSITAVGAHCKVQNQLVQDYDKCPACYSRYGSADIANKPEVLEYGGSLAVEAGTSDDQSISVVGINSNNIIGTSFAVPLFARHLAYIDHSLGNQVRNSETINAVAYSACKVTIDAPEFCGLGVLDVDDLSGMKTSSVRILFEGTFTGMTSNQIPVHELNIYIPSQPVEVTLLLVHSDNYRLGQVLDDYTAITVEGTKGQQNLLLKRGQNLRGWTHVRKEVYKYKKNSIGMWRFRLKPRLNKIPLSELPNLTIRYGGVLVIRAERPPKGYALIKDAIEAEMKKLARAGQALK